MKRYLGDGVYADFDGYYIVLTAEGELRAMNTIYLEPPVIKKLVECINELQKAK